LPSVNSVYPTFREMMKAKFEKEPEIKHWDLDLTEWEFDSSRDLSIELRRRKDNIRNFKNGFDWLDHCRRTEL
jgi:hypothetical protein